MPTKIDSTTLFNNGWIFKSNPSRQSPPEALTLLLHGFTGDENSMDQFARSLPPGHWMISPRAPYKAPEFGYSWSTAALNTPENLQNLTQSARSLWSELGEWLKILHISRPKIFHVVGFSQGGAMALLLSLLFTPEINKTACLSGFLPAGAAGWLQPGLLSGKEYFIAHGSMDATVPVEWARQLVSTLQSGGADVTYCETEVGHKVSFSCITSLAEFLG